MTRRDARIADAARVAAWGAAFYAGAQLAARVLSNNATAATAVQAAIAEWGAGRAGVVWSDPAAPIPTGAQMARRAAKGAAIGVAAALVAVGIAAVAHATTIGFTMPSIGALVLGLAVALLSAVRDELLLRGFVLRTTRDLLPAWATLAACAAASAAARLGAGEALLVPLAIEALRGLALGAIWMRDRGAWMAVGANTAWTFATSMLSGGGIFP